MKALTRLDTLALLVVLGLWSGNFVATKIGLNGIDVLFFSGWRFLIAGVCGLPFLKMPGKNLANLLVISVVLGTIHFAFLMYGIHGAGASASTIIYQLNVLFGVLLGILLFGEQFSYLRFGCIVVAIAGLTVTLWQKSDFSVSLALLSVAAAAFIFAYAQIMVKKVKGMPGFSINTWVNLLAAPQMFLLSFVFEGNQWALIQQIPLNSILALLYTSALSGVFAYGFWYYLLQKYPVGTILPMTLVVPLIGVILSTFLLGEVMTPQLIFGGAMILLSVVGIYMHDQIKILNPEGEPENERKK
jgi:O-acetylserine/cysteine efflux transporter